MKRIVSAFAVIAIVGSAFAFKPFGAGSVYCSNTCAQANRINFRVDPAGSVSNPCGTGISEYVLTSNSTCVQVGPSTTFTATPIGK